MTRELRDRTMALAGMFQCVHLVQRIAYSGMADTSAMECSVRSLFTLDAASTDAVYHGVCGVRTGLAALTTMFSGDERSTGRDLEITRYVISLMQLERRLARRGDLQERIQDGIREAEQAAEQFSVLHENVIARLAAVYQETISTLTPRILVNGEHLHLSNPDNAGRIRTLLLAGIRSAVLWRQKGGSRWQILMGRNRFVQTARDLIEECEHSGPD